MFGFGKSTEKENWEDFEQEALPHLEAVFRTAYWLVRDREEAEDLAQETLAQALKSFHRYERGTNCRAWLTQIMYHLNSNRKRKLGRMKVVEDTEEMIAETIAFEPEIPQKVTDEDVLAALERIPPNFREIVILADVEEFAYREIAEMLQIPSGTVMSRLHRGRKLLRVELAGYARNYGFKNVEKTGS
ncbi:MAG TPA: sigma-70 family RNA polymerase sigma factor [Pyrinomonadaceae bacterium]|mgnify:CR=1 FL=1|nr:sigma-70 family RNA polymerase sigma factor [Pyrinomonadaceae bacterium]